MHKVQMKSALLVALMATYVGNATATENGQNSYPVGVNTVLNGILPPPGSTQYFNYSLAYSANKFAGSDGRSVVPGFDLNVLVEAPRIVHTWNQTFGPFSLSSGVIVPISRVKIATPIGADTRTGIGDIIFEPLLISYVNPAKTFFGFFVTDLSVPTGAYSPNRLANNGLNVYSFMPLVSLTWFPSPAWELSVTAVLEKASPNRATKYHSGATAMLDYQIGYSVSQSIQLGLQGYLLRQITDDKVNGKKVAGDGFRGKAFAVGPQLRYMWSADSGVVVKYQREFSVRNRPEGNKFWVEFSFPI